MSSIATRPAASDDRRHALRRTGLEQLHHTRQTVRDVVAGDTTGVEGTHRQLRAGLTDRLGRDDADGLADVDELAGGQRTAVAGRAGADLGLAGQDRADPDLATPSSMQVVDLDVADVAAGRQHDVAVDARRPRPGCGRRRWSRRCRARSTPSAARRDRHQQTRSVPQSSSRMMTSCETSTRRRVR